MRAPLLILRRALFSEIIFSVSGAKRARFDAPKFRGTVGGEAAFPESAGVFMLLLDVTILFCEGEGFVGAYAVWERGSGANEW